MKPERIDYSRRPYVAWWHRKCNFFAMSSARNLTERGGRRGGIMFVAAIVNRWRGVSFAYSNRGMSRIVTSASREVPSRWYARRAFCQPNASTGAKIKIAWRMLLLREKEAANWARRKRLVALAPARACSIERREGDARRHVFAVRRETWA